MMLMLFARYASIGVLNTLIHWAIFAVCFYGFHTTQALANLTAFIVAVSFSFYANARLTFRTSASVIRYLLFVAFMGALSVAVGWTADVCDFSPLVTLITFSAISLVCGFIYSKFIVFRDAK